MHEDLVARVRYHIQKANFRAIIMHEIRRAPAIIPAEEGE